MAHLRLIVRSAAGAALSETDGEARAGNGGICMLVYNVLLSDDVWS